MEKIIKKWEIILQQDCDKEITYGRSVLIEMLNDFKSEVKKLNLPNVSNAKHTVCWSCGIAIKYHENGLPHYRCECGAVD